MSKLRRYILIALLLLCVPGLAHAQDGNRLVYGQTVNGRISNDGFRTVYSFRATRGEIIDAKMTRLEGNLDPALVLLDSDSNLIARDDDGGGNYDATLRSVTLPHEGTFFLIATRFGQQAGTTTGTYSLTLNRVGVASDPSLSSEATVLRYGDTVVMELSGEQHQQIYTFGALRGDLVSITMQRISGDLDPLLLLADSGGNVLLIADEDPASPGTLDAAITNWRINQSGNYLIVATRYGGAAGSSRGGYSLSLSRFSPDKLGFAADLPILLDYGAQASGSISRDVIYRYYAIEAQAGDTLRAEVTRTRGNLDPILTLYTADLRPLAEHDAGARGRFARITAFRVPVAGMYLLVVSRFNRETGITAGDYTLRISGQSVGQ